MALFSENILLVLNKMTSFGLASCKPSNAPMKFGHILSKMEGVPHSDPFCYQCLVRNLQHYVLIRPDIAFSVNKLYQFIHAPTNIHLVTSKRILKFLKGIMSHRLSIPKCSSYNLVDYCDFNRAINKEGRRSTGEYAIFFVKSLVSWMPVKKKVVVHLVQKLNIGY